MSAQAIQAATQALTGEKAGGTSLLARIAGLHRTQVSMLARGARPLTHDQRAKIVAGLRDHADRCDRLAAMVELA